MTAPVASGWSVGRVGLAPTGKRRLITAHTQIGHSGSLSRTSAVGSQSGRSIVGSTIIAVPFSFRIVLAPAYADYAADIRDTLAAETR
jgi:hypothetical protein